MNEIKTREVVSYSLGVTLLLWTNERLNTSYSIQGCFCVDNIFLEVDFFS
jgi:hypothetical protein